jgi:histidine triad (HIT) family protein
MSTEKTLFEKIIDGEIPCYKIYEDDKCIVILDKFPETRGKTLIITKKPIDYFFDLEDELYEHVLKISKKITKAIDKALKPIRTCMLIEGFEVPHAHIKLYPVYEKKLVISGGKEIEDKEAQEILEKIKAELN